MKRTPWPTREDAIRRVENSIYGQHAAVFHGDVGRALCTIVEIHLVMVWIDGDQDCVIAHSLEGFKQSGVAQESGGARAETFIRSRLYTVRQHGQLIVDSLGGTEIVWMTCMGGRTRIGSETVQYEAEDGRHVSRDTGKCLK